MSAGLSELHEAMLEAILDRAHLDEQEMLGVPLEDGEIDLLSCFGSLASDLEDSDDDQDETVL